MLGRVRGKLADTRRRGYDEGMMTVDDADVRLYAALMGRVYYSAVQREGSCYYYL
jgi:hypothetical protein